MQTAEQLVEMGYTKTIIERVNSKTRFNPTNGCLEWTGATRNGYGAVATKVVGNTGKVGIAHRVAWEMTNGPIEKGLLVCHKCDNPLCLNVAGGHLFLGTYKDNANDRDQKGRTVRGEDHKKSKLTEQDVREIRVLRHLGVTYSDLADEYAVASTTIRRVVLGQLWSHVK